MIIYGDYQAHSPSSLVLALLNSLMKYEMIPRQPNYKEIPSLINYYQENISYLLDFLHCFKYTGD